MVYHIKECIPVVIVELIIVVWVNALVVVDF